MAIEIIDGADVAVANIVATIFGPPNIGKTSLACTARDVVIFDFDRGLHRAQNRSGKDVIIVPNWEKINSLIESDVAKYSTIVVDTAGTCLDVLATYIMKKNDRLGSGGSLTIQGWGVLGNHFKGWLNMLRSYGKDVVLISQLREEVRKEETVYRLEVPGQSRNRITENSDIMGFYSANRAGERILSFALGGDRHTKNVGRGLPDYNLTRRDNEPEPGKMAEIIDLAKELINEAAQSTVKKRDHLMQLQVYFEAFKTAEEFQVALDKMTDKTPAEEKALLWKTAQGMGLGYDKENKTFFMQDPTPEEKD